jgi:hypothetical protein
VTRYLGLAEFFWLAEQVTGLDTTTLVKASRVELADSALHAPQAGYGDDDLDAVHAMLDVAAREIDEDAFAAWLRQRVRFAE